MRLYGGHIPTTPLQKMLLAGGAAVSAFSDPTRADMIAVLGETTGDRALRRMRDLMKQHADGLDLLVRRPRITEDAINMSMLRDMPEGTFGRAYADFMGHHEFSPDERSAVKFVDDEELAYVMARYRCARLQNVVLGLTASLFNLKRGARLLACSVWRASDSGG